MGNTDAGRQGAAPSTLVAAERCMEEAIAHCVITSLEAHDFPAARTRYQDERALEDLRVCVIAYSDAARAEGRDFEHAFERLTDFLGDKLPGPLTHDMVAAAAIGWFVESQRASA